MLEKIVALSHAGVTDDILITELEIVPDKIVALLNSTLQNGILTQADMRTKGIAHETSSDVFYDQNVIRVNLISSRHGRVMGAVIELALSKAGTGAHSVVLEQSDDTLFLRSDRDISNREARLELSERAMHSILVLIRPEAISSAIGADAFSHDNSYSDRTPSEHSQPPFEYRLGCSIPPSSFIKIIVSRKIKDYLSGIASMEIPLALVPERLTRAHYYDACSRVSQEVAILAPDFEPELRETLEAHRLIFSHVLRGEVPRGRELGSYLRLSQIAEEKGDVDGALFFLNKLLVLQDTNLVLMIKIGDLLNKKNTFEDIKNAGKYYMKAIVLDPSVVEAQEKMGDIFMTLAINHHYNKTALLNKAVAHFTEALKLNPCNDGPIKKIETIRTLL